MYIGTHSKCLEVAVCVRLHMHTQISHTHTCHMCIYIYSTNISLDN